MEKAAYYEISTYLKEVDRAVSPHELSVILGKSRVTIQSSLKRLLKNGWVIKEGSSPRTFYRAVDLTIGTRETTLVAEHTPKEALRTGMLELFVYRCNKKHTV